MYTNEQKKFAKVDYEEASESLNKICRLFAELDAECEKWLAHECYSIVNDASGGWITSDKAKRRLKQAYEQRNSEL